MSSSSDNSSASSSSGEEEDDGPIQKGTEKSDGRRPMAEEERRDSPDRGQEILLPWKTQVYLTIFHPIRIDKYDQFLPIFSYVFETRIPSFQLLLSKVPTRKSVKKLVEVIEEDDTKELVDTIERKVILEERNIDDDPPVDYEIGASTTNEITTPSCCMSEKRRDEGKLEHVEERFSSHHFVNTILFRFQPKSKESLKVSRSLITFWTRRAMKGRGKRIS